MELELRIHGDASEIEQVIQLIKGLSGPSSLTVKTGTLDEQAKEFVKGLGAEARKVFELITTSSLKGKGVEDAELKIILKREPHGVMGGLGRRWSSIAREDHGSPFRKSRAGIGSDEPGYYLLTDRHLAAFAEALELSHD